MPAVLTTNSKVILEKRYLEGDSVDHMWGRVSGGNESFRRLMSDLKFLPNSPTLFNMGKGNGCTSSACFTFEIADCMLWDNGVIREDSIVRTREKAISVAKAGGGVGYYFGNLRAKNSVISSIHRKACGPVTVLRDYHSISQLITQGGKRELAQMGVLPVWHDDIQEFIHCKDEDPQGLGSFNISVSWNNEWLNELARPDEPYRSTNRINNLWWEQVKAAWGHGCPGMLFFDTINQANPNPHLGMIHTVNPCGEVPNRSDEPCNLGSLSLPRYFDKGKGDIKWGELYDDAYTATLFLDDILDRNVFPHPDITKASLLTRKLGLGVMGWADILGMLHIHYDTEEAVRLAERVMLTISEAADKASIDMAETKGPYLGYCSTRTNGPKRRNETVTSIAPTGTIAIIAGVWGSIEPHFALRCERTTAEGIKLQDGVQDWIWEMFEGFVPKIASEIAPEWHVRHQAAFQKYTDLGVSKTINLPNSATVEDVSRIYRLMWESGCKGGTVYRDGCRQEQVLRKDSSGGESKKTKSVYQVSTSENRPIRVSEKDTKDPKRFTQIGVDDGTLVINRSDLSLTPANSPSTSSTSSTTTGQVIPDHSTNGESFVGLPRPGDPYPYPTPVAVPVPITPKDATPSTPPGTPQSSKRKLPGEAKTIRRKFEIGSVDGYLHVGLFEDGTPGEIFLRVSKQGSSVNGMLDAWAMTFSNALQHGMPLADLVRLHKGQRSEPSGITHVNEVPVCTSIHDFVVRWIEAKFLTPVLSSLQVVSPNLISNPIQSPPIQEQVYPPLTPCTGSGEYCPDCGTEMIRQGSCLVCTRSGCGFSRCS
jgi:ribonucleoside-diphosphate reductase alpha chain